MESPSASIADRVLTCVNVERARQGLAPLVRSPELCHAALDHSLEMARLDFFDFDTPNGISLGVRIRRAGYRGTTGCNLSHGYDNPEEAVAAWLGEPSTRASLLDREFVHLGIGVKDSRWTIILGAPPRRNRDLDGPAVVVWADTGMGGAGASGAGAGGAGAGAGAGQGTDSAEASRRAGERGADAPGAGTAGAGTTGAATGIGAAAGSAAPAGLPPRAEQHGLAARDDVRPERMLFRTPEICDRVYDRLSEERQAAGAPRLRPHTALGIAAQDGAVATYRAQPNGTARTTVLDVAAIDAAVAAARYPGRHQVLLAVGAGTVEAVVATWMADPAAREVLLAKDLVDVGLGLEASRWVLLLGGTRRELLDLINAARAGAGAAPLRRDPGLADAARLHAEEMARRGFLAEQTPEGQSPAARAGFGGRVVTLVLGAKDLDEAAARLLADETHRRSLLDPAAVAVGIGDASGRWTLLVGSPGR